jgi:transposase
LYFRFGNRLWGLTSESAKLLRLLSHTTVIAATAALHPRSAECYLLPSDFPGWYHVWYYYRTWRNDGILERINTLVRGDVRRKAGRDPEPSVAIIDSQSVEATVRVSKPQKWATKKDLIRACAPS